MPGFLNTKFEHFEKGGPGKYPWVMIREYSGAIDPALAPLLAIDEVMDFKEKRQGTVVIGEIPEQTPEGAMTIYREAQQRLSQNAKIINNSAIDFSICRILWDQGYTQEIIAGTLLQALKEDGRTQKHPGEHYVRKTVSRALADKMPAAGPPPEEENAPTM